MIYITTIYKIKRNFFVNNKSKTIKNHLKSTKVVKRRDYIDCKTNVKKETVTNKVYTETK